MPIHDQGYRRYGGRREAHGRVWWVIARAGIMSLLRRRLFLAVLLLAWIPFLVYSVIQYVAANFPQSSALAASPQTFRDLLGWQTVFVFFVTIFVGAGQIANDRRANALQIYLSKPLTRTDYVAGKLATLLAFLVSVTWLPGILLVVMQIVFSGSLAFISRNVYLVPAITLYSLILVFVSAFTVLALSSMSRSSRFVGIMYAGLFLFSSAMYNVLRAMTGSSSWAWISPMDLMSRLGDAIFRVRTGSTLPVPAALIAVFVIIAASILILEKRVRGVEVVT